VADLDRIDLLLIELLQNDARLSNKELAAKVGLAPSSTLGRVQRLREEGVLRGAHAEVDPEKLGVALQALVVIRIAQHSREVWDALQAHLFAQPEVVAMWHVGGEDDIIVHVAVRDARHLNDLMLDRITSRPEVARVRTEIVFAHERKPVTPSYVDVSRSRRSP
jgi:DNA-binding Lrp family transcriptional regulator